MATMNIEEKYVVGNIMGDGTFSLVFKGIHRITGEAVVLKQIDPDGFLGYDYSQGMPAEIKREVDLLNQIKSKQVVSLLENGMFRSQQGDQESCYLIFEVLDTDLHKVLMDKSVILNLNNIKALFYQLCKGLADCHQQSILHRDIKPDNLLLDENYDILKIADLGLGRNFGFPLTEYTPNIGTVMYRAPEILLCSKFYGPPVDLWSAGCVLAEMATGKTLFTRKKGDENLEQMKAIISKLGSPTEESWPGVSSMGNWKPEFEGAPPQNWTEPFDDRLGSEGVDLLSKMLIYNPDQRISAIEAMNHPFFDDLDKSIYD